jgi:predicted lipid-binding transport protein (Tim44 family)
MGGTGGFPIDIVLFAMIAAFLVLRLRSVLGRRQGFERPADPVQRLDETGRPQGPRVDGPIIDGTGEALRPRDLPDPASPAGQAMLRMVGVDRNFNPVRFLDGADVAFRLIVEAFAAGNRAALRPLLADETYHAFEAAISARETAGETQRTEIRGMHSATIEQADLRGTIADITVRFVSDQVNVTLGHDGLPVAGADAVTEITDLWTFERNLALPDPAWRLVAARSA